MKICRKCKTEQPLENFYDYKPARDGKNYKCKTCCISYTLDRLDQLHPGRKRRGERDHATRAESRKRYRNSEKGKAYDAAYRKTPQAKLSNKEFLKRRYAEVRKRLNEYKVTRGCNDCGYNTRPEALDFDHLPGTEKVFQVSRITGRSWERVLEEIAKCELVCANCHRVRTVDRKRQLQRDIAELL